MFIALDLIILYRAPLPSSEVLSLNTMDQMELVDQIRSIYKWQNMEAKMRKTKEVMGEMKLEVEMLVPSPKKTYKDSWFTRLI